MLKTVLSITYGKTVLTGGIWRAKVKVRFLAWRDPYSYILTLGILKPYLIRENCLYAEDAYDELQKDTKNQYDFQCLFYCVQKGGKP